MSFRTVVITNKSKLNYKNRFLVVKQELEEKYIHLSEIDTLIIDSISVSISTYLLKELSDYKINVIFCDERHNPYSELKNFYISYNSSKTIMQQIKWSKKIKDEFWAKIVVNKLRNQSFLLKKIKNDSYMLIESYILEVRDGDKTNREGHAAKVYFNSLFGQKFTRNGTDDINSALNYGYAILLSTISKEIISNGYITQLGIHHKNEYNDYNLTCDFMEVFRPVIDNFVFYNKGRKFDAQYKLDLVNLFNKTFPFKNKQYTLKDIIKRYVAVNLESINTQGNYQEFLYEG